MEHGFGNDVTTMAHEKNPVETLKERTRDIQTPAVCFNIDGEEVHIGQGAPAATLSLSAHALSRLISKETDSTALFMTGELTIDGDMNAAIAFGQAMEKGAAPAEPVMPAGDENDNIRYLDNVGLIVLDLEEAYRAYQRLGFNLAARGTHFYEKPEGVFTPWGTANHCVNFRDGGLLEFIAHYYPQHPAGLYGEQLKKHGNHWGKITIHCRDNDAEVERLQRQGFAISEPSILYRYTDGEAFDPAPGRSKRTSLFSYPTSFDDGFMMVGAQHALGEFPIADSHYAHPNGAVRIGFALIGSAAPGQTARRYAESLSIKAEEFDLGWRIALGRGSYLIFMSPTDLPQELMAQMGDRETAALGAGFHVEDPSQAADFLARAGAPTVEHPLGLGVLEPVRGSGAVFFSDKFPLAND